MYQVLGFMKYKHRDYSNKLLSNTEWNYLKNDNYSIYKNVGLGIIRFFDKQYKPNYNIPKLRERYKIKLINKSGIVVKHNSIEKMLAICSLGKTYYVREPIDNESKRLAKSFNFKVVENC